MKGEVQVIGSFVDVDQVYVDAVCIIRCRARLHTAGCCQY